MEKPKRAPRTKKIATAAAATTASVVSAFGGTTAPAIFIEEVVAPPPVPAPKKSTRKPAVVAVVTPDGIQGSLSSTEFRPLIAHLPIHSGEIDSDLFCKTATTESAPAAGSMPKPYDPNDVFEYYDPNTAAAPIASSGNKPPEPVSTRPPLPFYYSEKLMIRFQDANRDQRLPDSTDVACFWDCHTFRGVPCVIPIGIEEGIWRVYGNFSSPECAAAYLFHERLDSHVQWERYALLNRLYSSYLKETDQKSVRLAPPRTILRLFGGTQDITEYRDIITDRRMRVDVMTPPMISIIQVMDTKPIDFYDASMKNTFIPWEMDRMNRPGAQGLRLRRNKPVSEKEATLEYCMGITA
jgi:hypothetical protein